VNKQSNQQLIIDIFDENVFSILDVIPDAAVITDKEGTIVFVNVQTEHLFGYQKNELLGKKVEILIPEPYRNRHPEHRTNYFKSPRNRAMGSGMKLYGEKKSGDIFSVEISLNPIKTKNDLFAIATIRDITERILFEQKLEEKNQELENANSAKATFFKKTQYLDDKLKILGTLSASIVHEINNPIAWIQENLEWIKKESKTLTSIQLEELISETIHGIKRIREIIRNLKEFGRIDDNEIKIIDLHRVLNSVITIASSEIKLHAALETQFAQNLPLIKGNSSQLHQVFLNILMNAVQSIPEGDAKNNHILIKSLEDNNQVRVDIIDTGSGMSSEVLSHIFDPFFTTKSAETGTGLGLPISLEIIKNLGGNIKVQSTQGKGSIFSIYLPKAEEKSSISNKNEIISTKRKSILIVDDELLLLNSMQRSLKEHHDVTVFSDANEAIKYLLQNPEKYDLIIVDLNMPTMNGKNIYDYVAKQIPGFEKNILFMTGGFCTNDLESFVKNISNICIEKPFEQSELLNIISRMN
jgi:PAS domain S-box-containing protein